MQKGYYAVKIFGDPDDIIRLTNKRVASPLEAVDSVMGTRYSVERPMIADILHDFSTIRVKFMGSTVQSLRVAKTRLALLNSPEGWIQPGFSPERVAAVKAALKRASQR